MRNRQATLRNSLCTIVLLVGLFIPRAAQAAPTADAYEPDDTAGTASPILPGETQDHDLSPSGDVDWVSFELTTYTSVDLDIATSETGQMYLTLYDSTGTLLIESNNGSDGDGKPRIIRPCAEDPLPPGSYAARVDVSGGIEIAAYQLSFTAYSCQDTYEPDGDFSTSSMIFNAVPQEDHSIFPVSDSDYVTFYLDERSEIILTTSGYTPADTELVLYDDGFTPIDYDNDSNADGFSRIDRFCHSDPLEAGTYYARVNEYNHDEVIYNYRIDLSMMACAGGDAYEDDDDYSTATTITSGIPQMEHSIVPSNDWDWVTFTLGVPSAITLAISGPEPADTFLTLFDDQINNIAYNDNNGIDAFSTIQITCDADPLEAGTYYALVRENYEDAEIANYQIDLTTTPCDMGPTGDDYEADDTYDLATTLISGVPQADHSIYPATDVDWVTFTLDETSAISLATSGPEPADTLLTLYNETLNQVAYNDNNGTDNYSTISISCDSGPLEAGSYYAWVGERNNTEIENYQIDLTTTACDTGPAEDAFEDDDTWDIAKAIMNGVPQEHNILPIGDQDWVTFELTGQSAVRLQTSGSTGYDTRLYLYDDPDTGYIAYNDDSGGSAYSSIYITCLASGRYYAMVDDYNDDGEIPAYQLELTVAACSEGGDAYELDNTYKTASSLLHGIPQANHSILPEGDTDWVKFILAKEAGIQLLISGPLTGDVTMFLYDNPSNSALVYSDDSLIDRLCGVNPLEAGTYYARIDDFMNDGTISSYQVDLTVTNCDGSIVDMYEDDDTWDIAKAITSGLPQDHNISPLGDVDWVSFTLLAPSAIILETDGPAPTLDDTILTLFDSSLIFISLNDDKSIDNHYSRLAFDCLSPLAAGTYFARAYEDGNDLLIPAYQISLTIEACNHVYLPFIIKPLSAGAAPEPVGRLEHPVGNIINLIFSYRGY